MSTSLPTPVLNIAQSTNTVDVRIIDTTSRIHNVPATYFTKPSIQGYDNVDCPAYAFLITHKAANGTSTSMLFDLGVRKDWENLPPALFNRLQKGGFKAEIKKNVIEILQEHNIAPEAIDEIIWSHHHFDHTGDPSLFPSSTTLVVGPGFKSAFLPGYPEDPEGSINSSDFNNRELREISFLPADTGLQIGGYRAIDYFNDGSFYLLDSPGHAVGHLCALARTTSNPPRFIFMGGDVAHHGGAFRPTKYLPLPEIIRPDPRKGDVRFRGHQGCPGALFESVHPKKCGNEPFLKIADGTPKDLSEAQKSVDSLHDFDASEEVFVVIAHDTSLAGVIDFFPKTVNGWETKGWKEETRWKFLGDFQVDES